MRSVSDVVSSNSAIQGQTSQSVSVKGCTKRVITSHSPGRGGQVLYSTETVGAGTAVADVFDPATGRTTPVRCQSDGVFYARSSHRWATPGKRLGKVAGRTLQRSGKLLSP